MILYHFSTSPFARRIRLILSLKGLHAELRDPRADAQWWPELHRLNPCQTVPTLVDGERVFTDSLSIATYLESLVPSPSIWPTSEFLPEALELIRLADRVADMLVNLALHFHPVPSEIKTKLLVRGQGALELLAQKIAAKGNTPYLAGDSWTMADIAVVTLGVWLDGLPERAKAFPLAKQMVDLGWTVPPALASWTAARQSRADVSAL